MIKLQINAKNAISIVKNVQIVALNALNAHITS